MSRSACVMIADVSIGDHDFEDAAEDFPRGVARFDRPGGRLLKRRIHEPVT